MDKPTTQALIVIAIIIFAAFAVSRGTTHVSKNSCGPEDYSRCMDAIEANVPDHNGSEWTPAGI